MKPEKTNIFPKITHPIKCGEVYRARLDDAEGYEQKGDEKTGMRPVVIVSNDRQNIKKKVVVVVPLTTKQLDKIYPFQVPVYFRKKHGKAKCEQVRAITIERFEKKLGSLTSKEVEEIEEKLIMVLNLDNYIERKLKERLEEYF
ncbi:MAG: type II toxin-antitoxin system PemK/MazF family toxin [Candidatus Moeniiplasma glomeromycotorum]|nr:type II toxin-antitoxin system PemK/MazF family toxin [Candidatus Moeniiplasma glomeromycotorum]